MPVNIAKGGNTPVPTTALRAVLGWDGTADADATALLLTDAGRVRTDDDMIFYNQPASTDGSVRHAGKTQSGSGTRDALTVDLAAVPAQVDKVAVVASVDGTAFGQVPGLHLTVQDATGTDLVRFDITDANTETAFVFGEFYRRAGEWKFRAVGQGYATGLAGLAADFGISVADDEPTPPASAPAPSASASASPFAPMPVQPDPPAAAPAPFPSVAPISLVKQRHVNLEKTLATQPAAMVDMVKKATISLEKRGMGEHTARVCLVLDISGSMGKMYRHGAVQKLAERILALGLRFDDDGDVDVFLFGKNVHQPEPMNLANHQQYIASLTSRYPLEGGTSYGKAIEAVRRHYNGSAEPHGTPLSAPTPVFCMFVTDGRTDDKPKTEKMIRDSANEPIFWQFMGIGPKREFEFLAKLDDLKGRYVDNADFFNIEERELLGGKPISDEVLFDRLMTEYPKWCAEAKTMGVLTG